MVDAQVVAVLDRIEDLEEHPFSFIVVADVAIALVDIKEEITLRTIIENHVETVKLIKNLMYREHIVVSRRNRMEAHLSLMVNNMAILKRRAISFEFTQTLDSVSYSRTDIQSCVHDSVDTSPYYVSELDSSP